MSMAETLTEAPSEAVALPFKIGGHILPMLNHNASYNDAVRALSVLIERHYAKTGEKFYPYSELW